MYLHNINDEKNLWKCVFLILKWYKSFKPHLKVCFVICIRTLTTFLLNSLKSRIHFRENNFHIFLSFNDICSKNIKLYVPRNKTVFTGHFMIFCKLTHLYKVNRSFKFTIEQLTLFCGYHYKKKVSWTLPYPYKANILTLANKLRFYNVCA